MDEADVGYVTASEIQLLEVALSSQVAQPFVGYVSIGKTQVFQPCYLVQMGT